MTHRDPPGIIAPHIPADAYHRAETTGAPVVIVVHHTDRTGRPLRHYLFPIAVAGAGVIGVFGLVAALLALLDFAAHTAAAIAGAAGPIGVGGITLRLFRGKNT
jgi:F420-0:gamma-glutamyl ligase-like protein